MMLRGEHLQEDGLQTIVNIRASLNLGFSQVIVLKKAKDLPYRTDWVKVANIIKKGDHLTKEGSTEIVNIKSGMNKGRPDQ